MNATLTLHVGDWVWSREHVAACRVVDVQELWSERWYRVWLPPSDTVVRVDAASLAPLDGATSGSSHLTYLAAAARVAEALAGDEILAPVESSVLPLPHQVRALTRAIAADRVRFLLADEVGLGKTIEAGLILRELKLRGLVRRTLVVAPKGLVTQWVAEMRTHFGEEFRVVQPGEVGAFGRLAPGESLWRLHDQMVCPMDSVKPLAARRGWSAERVAAYNRERFKDLIAAGWDLVIVDEAHRLGGSTDDVARYALGQGLAAAAPYLLLLSATPHAGKSDAFLRLVALLDADAFPHAGSLTRERLAPYVIRTEKRRAVDARGQPLFQPRHTSLLPVAWTARHAPQRLLYEAVSDYVREGYNAALREKRNYIGFLMILMQRLVTSSTAAIRAALARRLGVLTEPVEDLEREPPATDLAELDGQEELELLLGARLAALRNEADEVRRLLALAEDAQRAAPDAKAEALLTAIYDLQALEVDPVLKVLVFTEFVPTQEMLARFLADRGFSVVCLNGSMDLDERRRVQEHFAGDTRILISTDAGGEGLNLQFCHVVVNYDIPWNPMRLEQRIGRVDRIGQAHPVRALNLILADTVEYHVREVLEAKLAIILKEMGVDKAGDVLDSAGAGHAFDTLYVESVLYPDAIDTRVESLLAEVRAEAQAVRESAAMLASDEALDPAGARRAAEHPLPQWTERMTVAYLQAHAGCVERNDWTWRLRWPDGYEVPAAVFNSAELAMAPTARHLTVEDERVRNIATRLPRFAAGQPIPCVALPDLPEGVRGYWSLWQVAARAPDRIERRMLPLFVHDNGRVFLPTARRIWELLLAQDVSLAGHVSGDDAARAFQRAHEAAELHGRTVYDELVHRHRERLRREREKMEYAFAARRRALERIGLPSVRAHRLTELNHEERAWRDAEIGRDPLSPELSPIIIVRIEATT